MKKGVLFGILIAFFLCLESAYADSCDVLDFFDDTYVGVGAIDMQKMPERAIYGKLMSFFMTDQDARRVLVDLEASGLTSKSVRRIVVGIPSDVEQAEFLMVWETVSPLAPYMPVLEKYVDSLDRKQSAGQTYYCKKQGGQCLLLLNDALVLASPSKMENFIRQLGSDARPKTATRLKKLTASVNQDRDAWLVFWLDDAQRARIGQGDPLVDMRAQGKGELRLGSVQSGDVAIDFSEGLNAEVVVRMTGPEQARAFSEILASLLETARHDEDIMALGLVDVISGIHVKAAQKNLHVSIRFSHDTFSRLIDVISDLVRMAARDGLEQATAGQLQP